MEAGTRCFYLPSTLSSGQLHSLHKTPGPCVPVVTSEDLNKRDSLGNAVLLGSQMWGIFCLLYWSVILELGVQYWVRCSFSPKCGVD